MFAWFNLKKNDIERTIRENQKKRIGVVVYHWILIMRIEWGGHSVIMLLGRMFVSGSVFVCACTIIMCIHSPKWPSHAGRELTPPLAFSIGCKVTGKTHAHRRSCCQVCWEGSVAGHRPEARRQGRRGNEEQPLVEFVHLRGSLNIWCCCLSDSHSCHFVLML